MQLSPKNLDEVDQLPKRDPLYYTTNYVVLP